MRAALLASVVFIGLIALALRSSSVQYGVGGNRTIIKTSKRVGASNVSSSVLRVEGNWHETLEDAERSALEKARYQVVGYLRNLTPPIEFTPTAEFIREKMVSKRVNTPRDFGEGVGRLQQVCLELDLTRPARSELVRLEREHRAQDRMVWLAKLLSLCVVLLAAVSSYVHLDERTKGYYTNWLRLAVTCVVAVVGAGFWWMV